MTNEPKRGNTNHGFEQPDFKGTVFGQTLCTDELRPTGKFLPFTKSDGSRGWMPIKERRTIHHWIWDGAEWLPSETFDTRYNTQAYIPPAFTPLEKQAKASAQAHDAPAELPLRSTVRTSFVPPSRPPRILVSKHSVNSFGDPNPRYKRK